MGKEERNRGANIMILFTKPNCHNCDIVKDAFDLKSLGIEIKELNKDNIDALADLAWLELVSESDRVMPILVLDDGSVVKGVEAVTEKLKVLKLEKIMELSKTYCNLLSGDGNCLSCGIGKDGAAKAVCDAFSILIVFMAAEILSHYVE
jgi:glutaredoxin